MRKFLYSTISIVACSCLFLLITAQKTPDNRKFYYAFSEKIYLTEVQNKFLIKVVSADDANILAKNIGDLTSKKGKDIIYQKDNCLLVEVADAKALMVAVKDAGTKVSFIKPCYKYQQAELYYSDEIIVETLQGREINEVISLLGLSKDIQVVSKKFYSILKTSPNIDALEVANKIQETGMVKYSHPDFFMNSETHQVIPNDTYFNNQYYLRNTGQVFNPVENHAGIPGADIRATLAWTMTTGNNAVVVAVIDEGVTGNHPDLPNARQIRLNGSNFAPGQDANDPNPNGNNNHGNACSGIIAATQGNNEGISGIAPNIRIMPIKVGFGVGGTSMQGFASAVDFAWQNGASIISNSWGTGSENPNFSPVLVAAINRAVTQGRGGLGSVVVISASNSASHNWGANGQVRFPSNVQINGVLTVGASDRFDMQADYSPNSNTGSPNNQIIDIVAPSHRAYPPEAYLPEAGGIPGEGFEIWTIDIPGNAGYNQWNNANFPRVAPAFGEVMPNFGANNLSYTSRMGGTSAACPEVAGVAALMLSVNPNLSQQQVFNLLTQAADDVGGYIYTNGWSIQMGNGRLDACEAVNLALSQVAAATIQTNCDAGTITVPSLAVGTTYNWQVNGDLLIDGISTTKNTTDNFINVTGTSGNAYVTAPTICGTLQWGANFTPHQREIQGLYPEYTCGDHVSVSVNTTPFDTYYRWYINNTLVKEGSSAYYYCTCYYETPDPRVSGDNTIRVEVETNCNTTSTFDGSFYRICGYRMQSNVEIFPNPAINQVSIRLKEINKNSSTGQLNDIREVRIVDKFGILKKLLKYPPNTKSIIVDVSNLSLNIYYLDVSDGRNNSRLPLSVQK
ncbi:MAG: S8 family serine peptidase [Niastella sp.]|nr:S8 family serine peptidase [Niastella sp.]